MREALQASVKARRTTGRTRPRKRAGNAAEPTGLLFGLTATAVRDDPSRSEPRAGGEAAAGGRIGTTREELAACEVRSVGGLDRPAPSGMRAWS